MSLLGTLLRPKHLSTATKVTECLRPSRKRSLKCAHTSSTPSKDGNHANNIHRSVQAHTQVGAQTVEDVFIRALVRASSCRNCSAVSSPYSKRLRGSVDTGHGRRKHNAIAGQSTRAFSSTADRKRSASHARVREDEDSSTEQRITNTPNWGKQIPRATYEDLANTYDSPPAFWQKLMRAPKPSLPFRPGSKYPPLAPRLVLTPEQESRSPYGERHILPPEDEHHAQQLDRLKRLLKQGPNFGPIRKQAWKIYQSLRKPRPRYLEDADMRRLLRNLTWVEFKTLESSKDYFAVLDECILEGVKLNAGEWNTAISFAGRWTKHATTEEVKTAVEAWMRMENHGVAADNVTFNILFDIAIRAGRYALADTIYEELKARDLPLNRYFYTSMIYYAGIRRNGDAVRQAFRQLVNAGEIVDTAVMNCVILSLVRSGEPASAWDVYQKMKELHAHKFGIRGPTDWVERKVQGRKLHLTGRQLRKAREAHEASFFGSLYSMEQQKEDAQRAAPIHPDNRTCAILIYHHAMVSGNFEAVTLLLKDLKEGGWKLHGSVYFNLFGGFERHGGYPGSLWKLEHLERLWQDFLTALGPPPAPPPEVQPDAEEHTSQSQIYIPFNDSSPVADNAKTLRVEEDSDIHLERANENLAPYFTPQLTIAVLSAFYTCAGAKRMVEVWRQVQDMWPGMSDNEKAMAESVVERFKREDGMYIV